MKGINIESTMTCVILDPEEAFNPGMPVFDETDLKNLINGWLQQCKNEKKERRVRCDRRYNWKPANHDKARLFLRVLAETADLNAPKIHLQMIDIPIDNKDLKPLIALMRLDKLASLDIQKNRLNEKGERKLENAKKKHPACTYLNYNNCVSER